MIRPDRRHARGIDQCSPIFFDLDGTLTDSSPGIIGSLHHALRRAGLPVPADDLNWLIGPPIQDSLHRLVGSEAHAAVFGYYRERYDEVGWRENQPYAGIRDMLTALTENDRELYVATAKPRVFAERILEHFDLRRFFTGIFGSELDGTRTHKDELLRWAIAEAGIAGRGVMVGDRRYDIAGARANGMRAIGVTWGFGTREELEGAGADLVVDCPQTLLTVLRSPWAPDQPT
jgi:phosphoglycolate phosphatase